MKHPAKRALAFVTMLILALSVFSVMGSAQAPEIKNIIYLIGDGMGQNHLKAYKFYEGIDTLNMETIKTDGYYGTQNTRAFGEMLTDSAAGGTALATGVRTWINAVGVYPTDPFAVFSYPMNLRELAEAKGMKSGIVVTKSSDDATPATFSAHTYARGNSEVINKQQLESSIEVLMGANTGFIGKEDAAAHGFAYAATRSEMNAVTSGKLIGQFDGSQIKKGLGEGDAPSLVEMADKAINMLENPNGFFLMIEGSTIDSFSHSNEMDGMLDAFKGFEAAVEYALAYARGRNDTMVLITADHETGGLTWDETKNEFYFTTGGHTTANVCYFAYLPEGVETPFGKNVDIKNIDIPTYAAITMGWGDEFPQAIYTNIGEPLKPVLGFFDSIMNGICQLFGMIPDPVMNIVMKPYLFVVDGIGELVGMF